MAYYVHQGSNGNKVVVEVWSFDHKAYYEMGNVLSRLGFGGVRHSNMMLSFTETA